MSDPILLTPILAPRPDGKGGMTPAKTLPAEVTVPLKAPVVLLGKSLQAGQTIRTTKAILGKLIALGVADAKGAQ